MPFGHAEERRQDRRRGGGLEQVTDDIVATRVAVEGDLVRVLTGLNLDGIGRASLEARPRVRAAPVLIETNVAPRVDVGREIRVVVGGAETEAIDREDDRRFVGACGVGRSTIGCCGHAGADAARPLGSARNRSLCVVTERAFIRALPPRSVRVARATRARVSGGARRAPGASRPAGAGARARGAAVSRGAALTPRTAHSRDAAFTCRAGGARGAARVERLVLE